MSTQRYLYTSKYNSNTDQWESVVEDNPHYKPPTSEDVENFKALVATPFVIAWNVIHGLADPHSRPTFLRWGAVLLFLTLGVPLLFGLGSLVVVTILKPHMMLSHLPELWAAIQHAL
ncbi:hypothetical protein HF288_13775 [Acidithiobacillus caldus]|uniref:hypothetical protein n=1 Tax=Acidithiobacillus caldus TaxID=33059 RepID=UPI001C067E73|nr:hypothetical protein [Acidithiobacillus caldus]MBU2791521.1 hypothetical protein [Acidithiobacillus caldus]MBU2822369.1 hypothetical protein [Acidithiobacillus caldus]